MRALYNILFTIFFVLSSPYYFVRMWRRGNWLTGFAQRFGKFDPNIKQALTNRQILWFHAVSVGEAGVCAQLIRALEPRLPNVKIVVSTTTTTGMGELQRKLPTHVTRIYYPIDRRGYVARALATIHPEAIIVVEAEIWPNFIWRARDLGIPLFLANARVSERSFRGYKRFAFLFQPLFTAFTGVGAQNEADAAKLREIGCRPEAVQVLGCLKFDTAKPDANKSSDVPALLAQIGVAKDALLLVAGSTHAGEEKILAEQFLRLRARFPRLFLILVPRHFERAKEVARQLESVGLKFIHRTEVKPDSRFAPGAVNCLLVNTTGELMSFYQHASVVFVGKSLIARGGQNPIEPAALGKPTVFGPNMQNFSDPVRCLLSQDGAVQVRDEAELETALAQLLGETARRDQLGRNALKVVRENLGAVNRTVDMIVDHLDDGEFYVAPAARAR